MLFRSFDGTTESDLWQIARDAAGEYQHPTQKPIELVARAVRNSTAPGALIYDPFAGSGPSIFACEQAKRMCRAIELKPEYVAVILQRWVDSGLPDPVKIVRGANDPQ